MITSLTRRWVTLCFSCFIKRRHAAFLLLFEIIIASSRTNGCGAATLQLGPWPPLATFQIQVACFFSLTPLCQYNPRAILIIFARILCFLLIPCFWLCFWAVTKSLQVVCIFFVSPTLSATSAVLSKFLEVFLEIWTWSYFLGLV